VGGKKGGLPPLKIDKPPYLHIYDINMEEKYLRKYKSRLVPISQRKPIYFLEKDPTIIVKAYNSEQQDAMWDECSLQDKASKIVRCPNIVECFVEDGVGYLLMQRIVGNSLADLYGADPADIPLKLWKKVRMIIYKLFCQDIHYIDITAYNFMIEASSGKLFIIDFGDAYERKVNWFLKEFIDGENAWNPDFA